MQATMLRCTSSALGVRAGRFERSHHTKPARPEGVISKAPALASAMRRFSGQAISFEPKANTRPGKKVVCTASFDPIADVSLVLPGILPFISSSIMAFTFIYAGMNWVYLKRYRESVSFLF